MIGLAVHRTLEGHIAGLGLADVGSKGCDVSVRRRHVDQGLT
jgi:hypothetical protein